MINYETKNYYEQTVDRDNKLVIGGSFEVLETAIVSGIFHLSVLATVIQADINSGKTIVEGIVGKTITILDVKEKVNGNFATGTSVELEDTNGTPVVIASTATAGLTDGAIINETETNTTMGAGYLGTLTEGAGIAVTKTGSAFTGGTSITYRIIYQIA